MTNVCHCIFYSPNVSFSVPKVVNLPVPESRLTLILNYSYYSPLSSLIQFLNPVFSV